MADIIRPIEPFELTQVFGVNPAAYARFGLKGHNGWDLKTKFPDTPEGRRNIMASWLMEFYKQADEGNDGYGKYFETICRLYSTWKLTFAHCHSIENFTSKKEGETMAISDSTGNVVPKGIPGAHLHFTAKIIKIINGVHQIQNYDNGFFGAVDPQGFFDEVRKFKQSGVKPIEANLPQMTLDDTTFKKLVGNSTKWDDTVRYLEIKEDPGITPFETVRNVIAGHKARESDLTKQLFTAHENIKKLEVEVGNRVEQLARLKDECQRREELHNSEYEALKKSVPNFDQYKREQQGIYNELYLKYDEAMKTKGTALIKIAELETKLEAAKKGEMAMTLIEKLLFLFRK